MMVLNQRRHLITMFGFDLLQHGINLCGAVEVAKKLGPGHTIVTVLCDDGSKYRSRLFNAEFLAATGLNA